MTATRATLERVKIAALACGVRVGAPTLARLGGADRLTVHEYATTGGITVELDDGVLVNAPFDEPFCAASPLELRADEDGRLELTLGEEGAPVLRVLPLPGYLGAVDAQGRAVAETTMSHADRIRVSPVDGCAYDCHFCDVARKRYRPRTADQVIAGIEVALADGALPPRHLLISGGSAAKGPAHQEDFALTCLEIVRSMRQRDPCFEVDIMLSARPDGPEFVDRMVDAGVSGFSINLEVYSPSHAAEHLPLKHRATRHHMAAMVEHAVVRLGRAGAVRSLLIPGLEPPDETLAGVEWLAAMGCSPVLSPFRPSRGTALASAPPVAAEVLADLLPAARRIVARHRVALGPRCVPCQHNTLAFPWDVVVDERDRAPTTIR